MAEHDMPEGPCACGAWHRPGPATNPERLCPFCGANSEVHACPAVQRVILTPEVFRG